MPATPPTAAQIKGAAIQEWGRRGGLANLDGVANEQRWDAQLPKVVAEVMKFNGHYVAFLAAGKVPQKDFLCVSAPGTQRSYIFNIDSFAMFQLKGEPARLAQKALVTSIMSPSFQENFNLNKGSIPVAAGVNMGRFDLCGQESGAYFTATAMINTLVPSIAHKMAQPAAIEDAFKETVAAFWSDDRMTSAQAMDRLVLGAQAKP